MNDEFQRASDALKRRQAADRNRNRCAAQQQKQTETFHSRRTAEIDGRIETRRVQRKVISEGPSTAIRHPTVSR